MFEVVNLTFPYFLDVEAILNSEVTSSKKIVQVFADFIQQSDNQVLASLNKEPMLLQKLGDVDSEGALKQLKDNCNFWKELNPPPKI
jgi:hypothetical protein